jgi:hypothetical protein
VRRARRAAVGGLLVALAVSRPLGAQALASGEIGLSLLRFPDDGVTMLAPSARAWLVRETPTLLTSAAAGGFAASGGAGGSIDLASEWRSALSGAWRADLGGELSGIAGTGSRSSGNAVLSLRMLRPILAGGIWLRANGSASRREAGGMWGRSVEAGSWWRGMRTLLSASLRREWSAAQLFLGPGRSNVVGTVPVAFLEGTAGMQLDVGRTALSFATTVRRDPGAAQATEAGFSATATFRQSESRAVVIGATKQLPDFERGADAVQMITMGIRLNEPTPIEARTARSRPIIQVGDDTTGQVLRVRAPGARRVEVMGDFTEWEPFELASTGDVFSRAVSLSSGTHRVVVRLDGGPWLPAANTPAVDDDFGGRVGLLVVP